MSAPVRQRALRRRTAIVVVEAPALHSNGSPWMLAQTIGGGTCHG
jgi:hypothetical protein